MALQMSRRDLDNYRSEVDRAHKSVARAQGEIQTYRAKESSMMAQLTQSLEVGGAALAFGAFAGRFPNRLKLGPVPTALAVGLGLSALGYSGLTSYGKHFANAGDGILATYLYTTGLGLGAPAATVPAGGAATDPRALMAGIGAGYPQMNAPYGYPGHAASTPLTEAELAAMAQAVPYG